MDRAAPTRTLRHRLHDLQQRVTATPARRRLAMIIAVLAGIWLLLAMFAWLAGPRLLTDWATGYVQEEFGHRLRIEEMSINPLKLSLTMRGLSLGDAKDRELVGFRTLVVDVDVTSLVRAMAILDEFRLERLRLNIERLDARRFNFSDLADRLAARFAAQQPGDAPPSAEKGRSLYFLVRHTEINDAGLRFADHTRSPLYETTVAPLNLRMDDLTSRPDAEAPYNFTATLGPGGTLSWAGDLTLEPLRSKGTVTLEGFGLSAAYDYIKDSFGFALPQGAMDVRVDYTADFSDTISVLRIEDGRVTVRGLSTTTLDDAPLFAFDTTEASGIRADLINSTAKVARLETRGGRVSFSLDEDGGSNLERALLPRVTATPTAQETDAAPGSAPQGSPATAAGSASSDTTAPAGTGWKVELESLAVLDYALDYSDAGTEPGARVALSGVNFEATGIRLPELPPVAFTLTANVAGAPAEAEATITNTATDTGNLGARGRYTLEGGVLDAEVQVTGLPLAIASPYLAGVGRLTLAAGTADWNGRVRTTRNGAGELQVSGSGRVAGVNLRDDVNKTRLATLAELSFENVDFRQPDASAGRQAASLALRRVTLAGLAAEVAINRDGVSNLQQVFAAAPAAASTGNAVAPAAATTPTSTTSPAPPMTLRLDSLVLRNNSVNFRDASPDLSFSAQLGNFGGRIDGLSSNPAQRAQVKLEGTVNKYAPLTVSGAINPLAAQAYSDLRVQLSSFDLGTLTPYTVTFIAHPLERGTLGAELDWKVAERRFDARNRIRIDGLALGDKREAPRATSLPVKLGIALLTNSEGDADLDVPAYGDLDDPQFRYGKVILQAFTNLLSRAVTSPFAALGNLGGGDKPDLVPFAPGSAELAESETARLAGIATALADKPLLSLAITGLASGNGDRDALRRHELELQLKREWLDSPFRRGKNPDEVTLDDDQRDDLLAKLYRRAGGDEAALRDASGAALPPERRRAVMEPALLAGIVLQEGALRELARARAQQVKDRLLAAGVAEARLVIVEGTPAATDEPGARLALDAR
jgi:hypothetical protein